MGIRVLPALCCFIATTAIALAVPVAQAAKPSTRVRCESLEGRWQHCALPFSGEVRVLRQLSRNPCIRNQSWGRDEQGVWVARGCRAEFGPVIEQTRGQASGWLTLRCESRNGGHRICAVDTSGGVKLTRQLSRGDCELDKSWGYDPDGVWVSRGCRAEFQVRQVSTPSTRFFGRLFGRGAADATREAAGRSVRCESIDGKRRECGVEQDLDRVELVRQLSRATCTRNGNWGWNANVIWVDKGCRAEFMAW